MQRTRRETKRAVTQRVQRLAALPQHRAPRNRGAPCPSCHRSRRHLGSAGQQRAAQARHGTAQRLAKPNANRKAARPPRGASPSVAKSWLLKGFRARAAPWERCKRLKKYNCPSRLLHTYSGRYTETACHVLTAGVWSGHVHPTHRTRLASVRPWCHGLFPHLSPRLSPVLPTVTIRTTSLAHFGQHRVEAPRARERGRHVVPVSPHTPTRHISPPRCP